MENKISVIKKFLVILFAVFSTQVFAQNYPITGINILLPSSPDPNTANWGMGKSFFMIAASARPVDGGVDPAVRESRLLVIITRGGVKVCGDYIINTAPVANFNIVNKQWNGYSAAAFLGRTCVLAAGDYELSVQFFGYRSGKTIALSDEKTKAFSIRGNNAATDQQPGIISQEVVAENRPGYPKRPDNQQPGAVNPRVVTENKPAYPNKPDNQQPGTVNPRVVTENKPAYPNKPDNQQSGTVNPRVVTENKPAYPNKPDNQQSGTANPRVVTENKPAYPNRPDNQQPGTINPRVVTENKPAYPNRPDNQQPATVNPRVVTENKPAYPNKPDNQQPGTVNPRVVTENKPAYPNKPDNQQPGTINPRVVTENKPAYPNKPDNQQPGADVKPGKPDMPANPKPDSASPVADNGAKPVKPKKTGLLGRLGKIAISSTGLGGTIDINLSSPVACECGNWSPITINRTMKFDCGGKNVIPWKCGELFDFLSTYNCTSKDRSCQAITGWEIKKDGVTIVGGQGDHNITGEFIPQANGNYTLTFTAACNGKKCEPCVYTIAVEGCKTCDCGAWGPLLVNRDVKYDCGYKNTIPWKCNQPFSFNSVYRCGANNQDCVATTNWEIARDGVVIKTGDASNSVADAFTPTANGTYTITLNASCSGIKCPPCTYTISVEDCRTCDCGSWGPLAVNNSVKFESAVKNTIQWKCSQPFSFTSTYRCGSNTQGCQAVTSWEIARDGIVIKTGEASNSVADAFTPTANGTYTITLNADCNGIKCPPAVYNIIVEGCTTCDCGSWGSLAVNNTVKFESAIKNTIKWKCSQPFSFTSAYRCGSNDQGCQAVTSWEIDKDGVSIKTGSGNIDVADAFTPAGNGTYTITLNADCNGIKCPPAVYNVIVEDCTTCDCGNWVSPVVNILANDHIISGLKCGELTTLSKGSYSIALPDFHCSAGDASCAVSYSWSVQGGPVVVNGTRQIFIYNFARAGTYTIDIMPICGGKKCQPCKLQIIVQDNLPPPNVEKTQTKRPASHQQHYYYVISPEYAGEVVSVNDTLFLQVQNNYSSGSNRLSYTIRNLSNDKTSRLASLVVTNNQGLMRIALPLQNSVVAKGETGQFIMGDYKKYYYISFKRN